MSTKCMINTFFSMDGKGSLNISDLCRNVGISRTIFYNYLDNKKIPSIEVAIKIAKYLNDNFGSNYRPDDLWIIE